MKIINIFIVFLLIISVLVFCPTTSKADIAVPSFPTCTNPTGTVKASYPNGNHAILGIIGLQSGSDQVYSIGSNNYMQCFCPTNGASGIQTNWFAAGGLSQIELNDLSTKGWTIIPNGADWGLSNQTYLAKNNNFSCGGGTGGNGGGGGGTSGNGSSNSNNSSGGANGAGGGEVLGISTLAATSNPKTKIEIFFLITLGLLLICYGVFKKIRNGSKS